MCEQKGMGMELRVNLVLVGYVLVWEEFHNPSHCCKEQSALHGLFTGSGQEERKPSRPWLQTVCTALPVLRQAAQEGRASPGKPGNHPWACAGALLHTAQERMVRSQHRPQAVSGIPQRALPTALPPS